MFDSTRVAEAFVLGRPHGPLAPVPGAWSNPMAEPMPAATGGWLAEVATTTGERVTVRCHRWVPGTPATAVAPNPAMAADVGRSLAASELLATAPCHSPAAPSSRTLPASAAALAAGCETEPTSGWPSAPRLLRRPGGHR